MPAHHMDAGYGKHSHATVGSGLRKRGVTRSSCKKKLQALKDFEVFMPPQHRNRFSELIQDVQDQFVIRQLTASVQRTRLKAAKRKCEKLEVAAKMYDRALQEYEAAFNFLQARQRTLGNYESTALQLQLPTSSPPAPSQAVKCDSTSVPPAADVPAHQVSDATTTLDPAQSDTMFTEVSPPPRRKMQQLQQPTNDSIQGHVVPPKDDASPTEADTSDNATEQIPKPPNQQKTSTSRPTKVTKKTSRHLVAEELLKTERSYVAGLKFLVDAYIGHHPSNSVPARKIYGNIHAVYRLNQGFLHALEEELQHWDDDQTLIGPLISKFAPRFRSYASYASQQGNAAFLMNSCLSTKPRFRRFVQQVQDDNPMQSSLETLLIAPVQRVPRYQLLVDSLIKKTPQSHKDHALLVEALQQMKTTAEVINRTIRAGQQLSKLIQLQALFPSVPFAAAMRSIMYHAKLYQMSLSGSFSCRYAFLLSNATLLMVSIDERTAESLSTAASKDEVASGRSLNWSDIELLKRCRDPALISLRGVVDGAVRSKVEEEQRERTVHSLLLTPLPSRSRGSMRLSIRKSLSRGRSNTGQQSSVADEVDSALAPERLAIAKAMQLVAAGKMSEEELMVMQQQVIDSTQDKILETEAQMGQVSAPGAVTYFEGFTLTDPLCGFQLWGEQQSFFAATQTRDLKREWMKQIETALVKNGLLADTLCNFRGEDSEDMPTRKEDTQAMLTAAAALDVRVSTTDTFNVCRRSQLTVALSTSGHAQLHTEYLGQVAPILSPTHLTSECQLCQTSFGVLKNRRRHCAVCGRLVCYHCKHGARKDPSLKVFVAGRKRYPCTQCKADLHLSDVSSADRGQTRPHVDDGSEPTEEMPSVAEVLRQKFLDGKITKEEYQHMCKVPAPVVVSSSPRHRASRRLSAANSSVPTSNGPVNVAAPELQSASARQKNDSLKTPVQTVQDSDQAQRLSLKGKRGNLIYLPAAEAAEMHRQRKLKQGSIHDSDSDSSLEECAAVNQLLSSNVQGTSTPTTSETATVRVNPTPTPSPASEDDLSILRTPTSSTEDENCSKASPLQTPTSSAIDEESSTDDEVEGSAYANRHRRRSVGVHQRPGGRNTAHEYRRSSLFSKTCKVCGAPSAEACQQQQASPFQWM